MKFDFRATIGLGETETLGGQKKVLCTRIQEKGEMSPQETEPGLPVCV